MGGEGEGGAGRGWNAAEAARGKRCALALMAASDDLLSFARARLVAPRCHSGWSRAVSEEWRHRLLVIQVRANLEAGVYLIGLGFRVYGLGKLACT